MAGARSNWAIDLTSQIRLPPLPIIGAALCKLSVSPFVSPPHRPVQRLSVSINGINVAKLELDRVRRIEFIIPKDVLSATEDNIFDFYHPDGMKPIDLGDSQDFRILSVCFHGMEILEWHRSEDERATTAPDYAFSWDGSQRGMDPSVRLGCGWDERKATDGLGLWLIGEQSDISLPSLPSRASGALTLDLSPSLINPYRTIQRLKVLLNGSEIGRYDLSERKTLAIEIPPRTLTENGRNILAFEHPDHFVPHDIIGNGDRRNVSAYVHDFRIQLAQREGAADVPPVSLKELFFRFESIGYDCEFGNVQRRAGAEPLGLFRWSATRIHKIVAGLANGFAGLGDVDKLELDCPTAIKEFMIRDKQYDLYYHTWQYEGQTDPEDLKIREAKKLKFLARKFLEDLEVGEKVLVYKHEPRVPDVEAAALLQAVRRLGRNPILIVEVAKDPTRVGEIDAIGDGLFRGYIDRFTSPDNPYGLSFETWVKLCSDPCFSAVTG